MLVLVVEGRVGVRGWAGRIFVVVTGLLGMTGVDFTNIRDSLLLCNHSYSMLVECRGSWGIWQRYDYLRKLDASRGVAKIL